MTAICVYCNKPLAEHKVPAPACVGETLTEIKTVLCGLTDLVCRMEKTLYDVLSVVNCAHDVVHDLRTHAHPV